VQTKAYLLQKYTVFAIFLKYKNLIKVLFNVPVTSDCYNLKNNSLYAKELSSLMRPCFSSVIQRNPRKATFQFHWTNLKKYRSPHQF